MSFMSDLRDKNRAAQQEKADDAKDQVVCDLQGAGWPAALIEALFAEGRYWITLRGGVQIFFTQVQDYGNGWAKLDVLVNTNIDGAYVPPMPSPMEVRVTDIVMCASHFSD